MECIAVQHITMECIEVQHITVECIEVQHIIMKCIAVAHITMECIEVQHITLEYIAVQHIVITMEQSFVQLCPLQTPILGSPLADLADLGGAEMSPAYPGSGSTCR